MKHKAFSALNIAGLAIGMCACFFIFHYVHFEKSFDQFHTNAPRIYRLLMGSSDPNSSTEAVTHPGVGPAMQKDFPEVESFVRIVPSKLLLKLTTFTRQKPGFADVSFNESGVFFADASFFSVFSFPIIRGNKKIALQGPWSIALSEAEASKYFGNEDPIGQPLKINGSFLGTVNAVFKDVPNNSHLKFDILLSFPEKDNKYGYGEFDWPEFYTYLLLTPGADPQTLTRHFPAFVNRYMSKTKDAYNYLNTLSLQPLEKVHLYSDYQTSIGQNGSITEVRFLTLIGIFILLIAWINYINLSTARGFQRAGEIGVRKVVGATRWQLAAQFFSDTFLIYFFSLVVAAGLLILLAPFYGGVVGISNPLTDMASGLLQEKGFWLILLCTFLGGIFLSAAYPTFVLASFNPVLVFKGKFIQSGRGIILRKGLVFFQFVITVLLIAGTLLISGQLNFMRKQSLGYNNEQLLVCTAPVIYDSSYRAKTNYFKSRMLENPSVTNFAATSDIPGEVIMYNNAVRRSDQNSKGSVDTYLAEIDERFVPTFQMDVAAGRNFNATDSSMITTAGTGNQNVLINETLAQKLGYSQPELAVNKRIIYSLGDAERAATVVGVIRNYHQKGLKDPYQSILYYFPSNSFWKYFSMKVNPVNVSTTIAKIQTLYGESFPGSAFEFFFLNDFFDAQYKADRQFARIFRVFTVLSIVVSSLGLIGLSSFAVTLRTSEIGVRKILGASVRSILFLLCQDFFRILVIASAVAIPLFYFFGSRWLSGYAFHIRIGFLLLSAPSFLLLIITVLTVAGQSFRSATASPAKTLRIQ